MPIPLIDDPTFKRVHNALHKLWTKAAYKDDYVKADWRELDEAIVRMARTGKPETSS